MQDCLTYFYVGYGDNFDMQDFCDCLNLSLDQINDNAKNRAFRVGSNREYDVNLNVMLRKTLKPLLGKENKLIALARKYGLTYSLVRVVYLKADEINPILSLENDIIEFMCITQTEDDLDYYVE